MNDLQRRVAALSPEKLALLMARTAGRGERGPDAGRDRQVIRRRGPGDPVALSLAQERMWFVQQLQPNSTAYNVAIAARLEGLPEPRLLRHALAEVVRRHEVLRAAVLRIDGQPRPFIDPGMRPGWGHADLSALPAAGREAWTLRLVEDEIFRPFDLSRGPLLRGLLVTLGPGDAAICLTIHHLVADGWSLAVLLRELVEIHRATVGARAWRLPELPIQYFDYALWQRRMLGSGAFAPQLAYWRERLAGSTFQLQLPADRPRARDAEWQGKTLRLSLGETQGLRVREWTRRQGVTLFTTALAALQALLGRSSGQLDFNVGTPVSGRNHVETEGLIGLFINLLTLRADLGGDPSFQQIVARAHVTVTEAYDNQDLPFQTLVEELQPQRGLYQSPLFQVALTRAPLQQPDLPGVVVQRLTVERWTAREDLILFVVDEDGRDLAFDFELSLALFDVVTIRRLAEHFRNLLTGAIASPDLRLSELPLLGEHERHQLVVEGASAPVASARGPVPGVSAAAPEPLPAVLPADRSQLLPLSFAQQRLWLLDRVDPGSPLHHLVAAFRLEGPLAPRLLDRGVLEIARRHEVLRTAIAVAAGTPWQRIAPEAAAALLRVDLSGLSGRARQQELARLLAGELERPFDLDRGPLWRATLLRLGRDHHVACFALHQVAGDPRSLEILIEELAAIYDAARQRRPASLPELPFQVADHAAWQRSFWQGEPLAAQLSYWRGVLGDPPPLLALPCDRARATARGRRGERVGIDLPPGVAPSLARLADAAQATLPLALLAAFQVLLVRYSGQDDIGVGMTVAGRVPAGTERLIGRFENVLIVRDRLADTGSFSAALRRVRDAALAAHAHQHLPFDKLVEELHPELSRRDAPLLQTHFAFAEAPWRPPALAGCVVEPLPPVRTVTSYDLALSFAVRREGLAGALAWCADLFDTATGGRIAGHLGNLLTGIAEDASAPLLDLPLLGAAEMRQLAAWGEAVTRYPRDRALDELFASCVERWPAAEALVFGDESMTYADLDHRANGLAHELLARGVGRGTLVGIMAGPSRDFIVGALAVLKAGGAYVPLDPGYPAARLAFMVEDTQTPVVLLPAGAAAHFPLGGARPVPLDGALPRADAPPRRSSPEDLAYVIYTSGSTGQPKGVAVPHRAVVRLVAGTNYVDLGPGERIGHASTVSFDAATFEIWGALASGGCVVEVPRRVLLSPALLAQHLVFHRITTLFLTTALFNQVARENPRAFAPLRNLLFGGEAVDPWSVRRVLVQGPPGRLLHVYGPTESTTFALFHEVETVSEDAATLPIGGPVANTSCHLLDWRLRPVPAGVVGEILLGADGLAHGYLNRPDLTAECFIPAVVGGAGERLYRTGDLGRRRADGAVEFVGRTDDQVKLRGFRIEPGEIRGILLQHPSVRDAAVVASSDGLSERRLVAYVCGAAGRAPDEVELRQFLALQLPEHMVPAAFVTLDDLPLTPGGKLDRAALPSPDQARPHGAARYTAPRTPIEEMLADIWAELLGRDRVGVHDDFFELGGHSLLAAQIVWRANKAFHVELPVTSLFEYPTVAELATPVQRALSGAQQIDLPPIRETRRHGRAPLSFAQERLWFVEQLSPGSAAYLIPFSVRLHGRLAVPVLARTLAELVRRHEILRTLFHSHHGRPHQSVQLAREWSLPLVDLEGLPRAVAEAEVRRIDREEAARPFLLDRELPLRAMLVRLGGEIHQALFTVHHIASDGWSVGILVREVREIYNAYRRGEPSPLPPLALQYADYAAWQRGWLSGEVLRRHLGYWRRLLLDADAEMGLPRRTVPAAGGPRQALVHLDLGSEIVAQLAQLGRRQGATLFMTTLAAFFALLWRCGGRERICVGVPFSGRSRAELRGLIGFFVNMLVIRADLGKDLSFSDLLRQVRERALGAFLHQELPFQHLVHELRGDREGSQAPLFQAAFTLEAEEREALDLAGLALEQTEDMGSAMKFDLLLQLRRAPSGLTGSLTYDRCRFDDTAMAAIAGQYVRLLHAAVAEPELRLADLSLHEEAGAPAALPQVGAWKLAEEFRFEL